MRHVVARCTLHVGHHVALLWRELIGWELVGRHSTLKRLLRVGPRREVLLLVQPLSHALKHVGLDLAHLLHVVLLLHALGLA